MRSTGLIHPRRRLKIWSANGVRIAPLLGVGALLLSPMLGQPGPAVRLARLSGEIVLDGQARRVTRSGETLHLTPTEYKLFVLLARYQGKVLTTSQIFTEVWGSESANDPQMLRTHVARLRKKIDPHPSAGSLIATERGVGYWLNCPDSSS